MSIQNRYTIHFNGSLYNKRPICSVLDAIDLSFVYACVLTYIRTGFTEAYMRRCHCGLTETRKKHCSTDHTLVDVNRAKISHMDKELPWSKTGWAPSAYPAVSKPSPWAEHGMQTRSATLPNPGVHSSVAITSESIPVERWICVLVN